MPAAYLELLSQSGNLANVRRMLTQDADYDPLRSAYALARTAAALVCDDKAARAMLAFEMVALIKELDGDVFDFSHNN